MQVNHFLLFVASFLCRKLFVVCHHFFSISLTISLVKLAPDSVSVAGCLIYQKAAQMENESKQKAKKIVQHKVVMRELIIDLLCCIVLCTNK